MELKNSNGNGIWEIVKEFYRAKTVFNGFYDSYNCEGTVGAKDFESLVEEQMKPLKERASEVLKSTGDRELDLGNDLFNIVLHELVHEVRDLSSAIRQVGYISKVEEYAVKNGLSKAETVLVKQLGDVLGDAQERIPRKYKEVYDLFDKTTDVLEQNILPVYKNNISLLQSMILHEDVFQDDDTSRLPDIWGYMFEDGDGAFEAYYRAGAKWLKDSHVENAIKYLNIAFDQYDQKQEDSEFVERNKDKIGNSLKGINGILDKGLAYLGTLIRRGEDTSETSMNLQGLRNRLSDYLN